MPNGTARVDILARVLPRDSPEHSYFVFTYRGTRRVFPTFTPEPMIYAIEYNKDRITRLISPLQKIADHFIQEDGVITMFRVQGDSGTGNCTFNVAINDVPLYSGGDRLTLLSGNKSVEKTGLSIAVLKDDIVRFDLEAITGSGLWQQGPTFSTKVEPA